MLTYLDYSGDIARIARDPAIVIPARSDPTPVIRPWLLIENVTGERSLLLPHEDSPRSRELAAILRGHTVSIADISLPGADEMRVIRWLAGYRFTRFILPPEDERQVREVCADANSVSETVASAVCALPYDESAVRANLYSQIWRHAITLVNLQTGMSDVATVVAACKRKSTPTSANSMSRLSPKSSATPPRFARDARRSPTPSPLLMRPSQ